jgi:SAM-dependent methyltransferase
MASSAEHYETLLAPVYLWMAGGLEHALALGTSDIADVVGRGKVAVDLGAGFGMHAIPLANAGFRVSAIDSSAFLVDQLRSFAVDADIHAVVGDLIEFPQLLPHGRKADVIVCMGDTLTHLPAAADVDRLAARVAETLAPGGRFLATFRDYTRLPVGVARVIPVRSDPDRIHTCFLEEHADHVLVHDLLHERQAERWAMRVGSYRKLRLSPETVRRSFQSAGLAAAVAPGPRGMVKLTADA